MNTLDRSKPAPPVGAAKQNHHVQRCAQCKRFARLWPGETRCDRCNGFLALEFVPSRVSADERTHHPAAAHRWRRRPRRRVAAQQDRQALTAVLEALATVAMVLLALWPAVKAGVDTAASGANQREARVG